MGNKATQPRSFNTIRHSQTKVRAQRRRTQRVVLLAMFATVALILVTLLVLGGFLAVNAIINAQQPPNSGDDPSTPVSDIVFISRTESSAGISVGDLVLVNSQNRYTFPPISLLSIFDNMSIKANGSSIYRPVSNDYKLQADAFRAFDAMMYRYYELDSDSSFAVSSAYRTLEDQGALTGTSIQPGYSDHHTGYCVAIQYYDRSPLEADHWIYQNCHKYGFIIRYPEEKSNITNVSDYTHCLRYVGIPHATYMYENDLCMEEYLDRLKNIHSSSADRLAFTAADGVDYEIYYVPSSGGDVTTFDVPSNYNYTVSGDNRSGFIVTIKKTAPAA